MSATAQISLPAFVSVTIPSADAIVSNGPPTQQKRKKNMSSRHQAGSVFARGKKWHGSFWCDVQGQEKRKHQVIVLGERKFMTKPEARNALAQIIGAQGINQPAYLERVEGTRKTFGDVADAWEAKYLPQLALSTQTEAPGQIAKHLRPFFGPLPIKDIKTATVDEWIRGLVKLGLSPKTVRNQWKTFRAIMNWNTKQNDEAQRPFSPSLPRIPESARRWFTPTEMDQIIDISAGYPGRGILKGQYKPLFRLDAYSGLRSGEISGLHVEDINFARGFIHVRRSVFHGVEVPTKGQRSRSVYVDSSTLQMLKAYLGDRTAGRVFQGNNGKPIRNQQLNTVLTWATEQLAIARGTMHAFRHGRNSHMRQNGVPVNIILKQVGHQDEQTNLIYTHNEEAFIRETVEKLARPCIQTPNLYPNDASASRT